MKLASTASRRMKKIHDWAHEQLCAFTSPEIVASLKMPATTVDKDLRRMVEAGLLTREKAVVNRHATWMYRSAPGVKFSAATVGKIRSEQDVSTARVIVRAAEQLGMVRPDYLACLFGPKGAAA